MFEEIVEENPDQYKTYLSLGHAYKTLGDLDKSIDAYRQVYQVKPDFGDAFWSLANTKTYKFTDNEIQHMLSYEKKLEVSTVDRVHLCFALGKSYEDQKDYEKAFEFYERGNKLNMEELKYNSPLIVNRVKRQIEVCSQTLFSNRADVGYKAPDPIFIVGFTKGGFYLVGADFSFSLISRWNNGIAQYFEFGLFVYVVDLAKVIIQNRNIRKYYMS